MIKRNRVRTYIDRLFCMNCNEEMDNISSYTKTYYTYECPNCKKTETSEGVYPKLVYEDV